jgi:hypothetical protein
MTPILEERHETINSDGFTTRFIHPRHFESFSALDQVTMISFSQFTANDVSIHGQRRDTLYSDPGKRGAKWTAKSKAVSWTSSHTCLFIDPNMIGRFRLWCTKVRESYASGAPGSRNTPKRSSNGFICRSCWCEHDNASTEVARSWGEIWSGNNVISNRDSISSCCRCAIPSRVL